jgi:hypothetical protein
VVFEDPLVHKRELAILDGVNVDLAMAALTRHARRMKLISNQKRLRRENARRIARSPGRRREPTWA